MYQPETYAAALGWMIVSMLCWGSWANTVKICPGYRFQLFYWDYIVGLIVAALMWGVSFGSLGSGGRSFFPDLLHADKAHILLAMLGGMIFNVANLLLVAAIDLAGLAVAFPVGIGLALVIGAVSSYLLEPKGNPFLLFGGIALVVAAIVLDAMAYRLREREKASPGWRGVILSLVSGVLMGSFYPFVSKAMAGTDPPGPYATTMFFVLGVALSAIPVNLTLMRWPLDKAEPASIRGFVEAPGRWHLWGAIGGAIWCTGAVLNFVAARAHAVGPAVSYSIGQGATMVSACWGVFFWREFATAPTRARAILPWMFLFFMAGLTSVALAPLLK
jgi:glucose uptake protein